MFPKLAVTAVSGLLAAGLLAAPARADRPFTPRFSTNDTGAVALAGAPLMTCSTSAGPNASKCAAARSGTTSPPDNNDLVMVPVDTASFGLNSSTARLSLPPDAQVLFAGLYWGADESAGKDAAGRVNGAPPPPGTDVSHARFQVPGGSPTPVTADQTDRGTGGRGNSTASNRYQSFKDVTAQVAAAGAGTYALGDVRLGTGGDRYAGWSLVVAYRDPTLPARNLTVFDGLTTILAGAAPRAVTVSGFRTPPSGPVRTTVGFVTYEGDRGLVGDSASLNGTTLSDAANPASNAFNSSSSRRGAPYADRDPADPNQLGYDSDLVDADAILPNGATDATVRLSTSGDQYLPGVITFASDLYAPDLALVKSVADLTHPAPGAPTQRGDVLRYTVRATNTGDDGADDVTLRDLVPAGTTYVPGSLHVGAVPVTDVAGDDAGELEAAGPRVVARLGAGATATRGGRLAKGASATLSFDVRVGDVAPRTVITNAAGATYVGQSLRTPLTAISNEVTTTVSAPDLTLTKAHLPAFVAGGASTYRLDVSDVGDLATDGTQVVVTDLLPAGAFSAVTAAGGDGWDCTVAGLQVRCTRGDVLAAGASWPPVTLAVILADPAPATITNTAEVAGGGDAVLTNNSATDVGATTPAAAASGATPAPPVGGSALNSSPAPAPAPAPSTSSGPSGSPAPAPPTGSAESRQGVPATPARAVLALAKTASRARLRPGQTVRYALRLRVPGGRRAVGVRVCDRLPGGLTLVSAPGARLSGGSACWRLGTLTAGATRTLHLTVRAERGGAARSIVNTAAATARNAARVTAQATVRVGADTRPGRPGGVTG